MIIKTIKITKDFNTIQKIKEEDFIRFHGIAEFEKLEAEGILKTKYAIYTYKK